VDGAGQGFAASCFEPGQGLGAVWAMLAAEKAKVISRSRNGVLGDIVYRLLPDTLTGDRGGLLYSASEVFRGRVGSSLQFYLYFLLDI